jgi:hypothetical protein
MFPLSDYSHLLLVPSPSSRLPFYGLGATRNRIRHAPRWLSSCLIYNSPPLIGPISGIAYYNSRLPSPSQRTSRGNISSKSPFTRVSPKLAIRYLNIKEDERQEHRKRRIQGVVVLCAIDPRSFVYFSQHRQQLPGMKFGLSSWSLLAYLCIQSTGPRM